MCVCVWMCMCVPVREKQKGKGGEKWKALVEGGGGAKGLDIAGVWTSVEWVGEDTTNNERRGGGNDKEVGWKGWQTGNPMDWLAGWSVG